MDPIGKTKFGVLAIGSVAASLILWLSVSFWLDAWHQHEDARQLRRVSAIEDTLVGIARDVAAERADTLALLADLRNGGARNARSLSLASLRDLRRSLDSRLDATLAVIESAIDDPVLAGRLEHSSAALHASLDAIAETRQAFAGQRAASAHLLSSKAAGEARTSAATRNIAMRRSFVLGSQLVEQLHLLQRGISVEPRTAVRPIESLRRMKSDLRDFAESAARASALSSVHATRNGDAQDAWDTTTPQALIHVRAQIDKLTLHTREQTIDPTLLSGLDALIVAYDRAPARANDSGELRQLVTTLDDRIGRAITAETDDLAAHARRRLLIDTLLIVVCFWIAFASLRLLRNVQHQAWHDRLTGLPNRFRLDRLLDSALSETREHDGTLAVFVLGIDDFKAVNESLGHGVGDGLLCRLSERLSACLAPKCTLAALGGDEFAVIVPAAGSTCAAVAEAEKLRLTCREPFDVEGAALRATISVGIAVSRMDASDDGTDAASALLQRADIAMRQAKDDGCDRAQLFDQSLAERNRERIVLLADLRRAVDEGQFELHYQPKVGMRSGRVDGLEALVRWRHPERGLVSPGLFIPLAERSGLISPIGAWVLDEAARQNAAWHRDGHDALQVAVNVSAAQFVEAGFVERVEHTLAKYTLQARHLELELTESVGMMDIDCVVDRLERLRAAGVSIAIDDFGTGYSSLQYLASLPLDNLKIDRSFVATLDGDDRGRSLARTIVLMAQSLDLKTVAEGVETIGQLERVVALGCDHVQGYYYSKPVPADEVPATIARIEAELASVVRRVA